MRPIPQKHRDQFDIDPYFKKSCLSGMPATWDDPIVIHHPFIYAGKQVNEMWCYCPLLESEHAYSSKKPAVHNNQKIKEQVELIALKRATPDDFKKYPRMDWVGLKNRLEKKYGK